MKKINIDFIKDLIISVLIVICIVLGVAVIFYEQISLTKTIPQAEDYMLTDEMEKDLNKTATNDSEEIITKYHIDASDLKKYEKTKEYNKGKKNPFALESDDTTVNMNSNTTNSTVDSNKFYEDEGIK